MEEKRLALSKELFEKIVVGQDTVVSEVKADHVPLQAAVEAIEGLNDLQVWISENKTGQVPPKPIEYEGFKSSLPPSPSPSPAPSTPAPTPSPSVVATSTPSPSPAPTPSIRSSGPSPTSSSSSLPVNNNNNAGEEVRATPVGRGIGSLIGGNPLVRGGVALPGVGGGRGRGGAGGVSTGTLRSNPPAPPRASATVVKARAEYDYQAQDDTELGFDVGDILIITKQDPSGWWEGNINGRSGMFPGNYVTLIDSNAPATKKCKVSLFFSLSIFISLKPCQDHLWILTKIKKRYYTSSQQIRAMNCQLKLERLLQY